MCQAGPKVSVVMTLLFPRGLALGSVASWTDRQTLPREQIELIVVSNGADPRLDQAVRARLAGGDQFLLASSANEMELYDHGARQARAPWLLFTEAHVRADPGCLAALLAHLEQTGEDGVCVRTLPARERHWVARVEERMYREDAARWTQPGDWRKFTKRGFLLRRSAYQQVGGLEHRYRHYAELAIAARLQQHGYRIGFAPAAVIHHVNSTDLDELLDYVWTFRQQACAFERDYPAALPEGNQGVRAIHPAAQASMADAARQALRGALRRLHTAAGRRLAWTMAQACLRERLPLPPSWPCRLRYWRARLRLWLAWQDAFPAFMQVWQCLGDLAETVFHQQARPHPPRPIQLPWQPGASAADRLAGFYPLEQWQGRSFRWTAPLACLAMNLPPGNWRLTLDTQGLRPVALDEVCLFLNGQIALPDRHATAGRLQFQLPKDHFAASDDQILTLACSAFHGRHDPRPLGLPLFAIEAEKAAPITPVPHRGTVAATARPACHRSRLTKAPGQ